MKQDATIRYKSKKKYCPKAILVTHREILQESQFIITATYYVPIEDIKQPIPKAAISITGGDDTFRFVSSSTKELSDIFFRLYQFVEGMEDKVQLEVDEHQQAWIDKQQEQHDKRVRKPKVVNMKKGGAL